MSRSQGNGTGEGTCPAGMTQSGREMMKTVYLETSIVSYHVATPSRDVVVLARQQLTREWWNRERYRYDLVISPVVTGEAQRGDSVMAERRIAVLAPIRSLEPCEEIAPLAQRLKSALHIPDAKEIDSFHFAYAIQYHVDYLLTWNFAHFANPKTEAMLAEFTKSAGLWLPAVCTPEELLEEDER